MPDLRVPDLSRFTVAMIALLVSTLAVHGGHADLLPFMRRADGGLLALGLWVAVLMPSLWRDDRSRPRSPGRGPHGDD